MAPAAVAELFRIEWHKVGLWGSIATQLIMGAAALTVRPSLGAGWWWYASTFVTMILIYLIVRRHPSPAWWLVWPTAALVRLMTFGVVNHVAAQLVTGLIFFFFLYAGVTQPQGRSLWLLPLALVALRGLTDLPIQVAIVRLSIAAIVWSLAAELPAYLLKRLAAQQQILVVTAETDSLTGARNRHGLEELLLHLRGRAFMVILDLDHFKRYNDTHGHLAGDQVLVAFASMLMRECRLPDVVIRYGGEEFLVLLVDVDRRVAEAVVGRWRNSWRQDPSGVTFSAGVTDLVDDLALPRADRALYAAKAAGRDRTVVTLSGDSTGDHSNVEAVQPSLRSADSARSPGPGRYQALEPGERSAAGRSVFLDAIDPLRRGPTGGADGTATVQPVCRLQES